MRGMKSLRINIPQDLHKQFKVAASGNDETMQAAMSRLIREFIHEVGGASTLSLPTTNREDELYDETKFT